MKRFVLTTIGLSLLMGLLITEFTFASYDLPVKIAVSIAEHSSVDVNKKHHRKNYHRKYKRKIKYGNRPY